VGVGESNPDYDHPPACYPCLVMPCRAAPGRAWPCLTLPCRALRGCRRVEPRLRPSTRLLPLPCHAAPRRARPRPDSPRPPPPTPPPPPRLSCLPGRAWRVVHPRFRPSTRVLPFPCHAAPRRARPRRAPSRPPLPCVGVGESNPDDDHPPACYPCPAAPSRA